MTATHSSTHTSLDGTEDTGQTPEETPAPPGIWELLDMPGPWFWALVGTLLVLLGGYALRTQALAGPLVGRLVARVAVEKDFSVEVGRLEPSGLTGLVLRDVGFAAERGPVRLEGWVHEVHLWPDLWASLAEGRPVLGGGRLVGGQVRAVLERRAGESAEGDGPVATPGGLEEVWQALGGLPVADDFALEVADVAVGLDVPGPVGLREDLRVLQSRLALAPMSGGGGRALVVRDFSGEGLWAAHPEEPQASRQRVGWRFGAREGHRSLAGRLEPLASGRLDLGAILEGTDLFEAGRLGAITACLGCGEAGLGVGVGLENLELRGLALAAQGSPLGKLDVVVPSATAHLVGMGRAVGVEVPRMVVGHFGADHLRLADVRGRWQSEGRGLEVRATVLDAGRGRALVDLRRPGREDSWLGRAWFSDFDLGPALKLVHAQLPVQLPLRAGRVDGMVEGRFERDSGVVSGQSRVDLRDLALSVPLIAREELVFERLFVSTEFLVDVPGRSLSFAGGHAFVGDSGSVDFSGHVVDVDPGVSFQLALRGEDLQASQVLAGLPRAMTGVLQDARLLGGFGFALKLGGLSTVPDALRFDVDFDGDVRVVRDGADIDLLALRQGIYRQVPGRQSGLLRRISPKDWTSYQSLPRHVPLAMVAAEDATFFRHDGLDWKGLRSALVHNLREGALVRGGSTISQQLAKNLFLTRERNLSRKLQEAFLTWRVETMLDKDRILELYLNVVEWGEGVYGIRDAARHYFQAAPEDLGVGEAALLASILPSPVRFGRLLDAGWIPRSRVVKATSSLNNLRILGQIDGPRYEELRQQLGQGRVGRKSYRTCADAPLAGEQEAGQGDTPSSRGPRCAEVLSAEPKAPGVAGP